MVGTVIVSTPTANLKFSANSFVGSLTGSATAQIDLKPNTTYFIQNTATGQVAQFNVSTGTVLLFNASTATISSGTYTNATISGPTLAYSSGTFLNSVAIGTTNVNGQPLRIIDTNGSGVASLESSTSTTLSLNLKNSTAGASPNLVASIIGKNGDSGTGAVNGDGLVRTANTLWFSAGGATAASEMKISPSGVNFSSGIFLSGSAGGSGQVLTSGGSGAVPTWTTVSGGGGGASSLAISSGSAANSVQVSSPTSKIVVDSNTFVASLAASTSAFLRLNASERNASRQRNKPGDAFSFDNFE